MRAARGERRRRMAGDVLEMGWTESHPGKPRGQCCANSPVDIVQRMSSADCATERQGESASAPRVSCWTMGRRRRCGSRARRWTEVRCVLVLLPHDVWSRTGMLPTLRLGLATVLPTETPAVPCMDLSSLVARRAPAAVVHVPPVDGRKKGVGWRRWRRGGRELGKGRRRRRGEGSAKCNCTVVGSNNKSAVDCVH